MDWLEKELKIALARKEPAPGFDARIQRRLVRTMPRWMAAAAAIVVIAGGGALYRRHRGEQAKEQVMLALRIAGAKLNHVQARMQAVGERQ
jgi:hypothetical protein